MKHVGYYPRYCVWELTLRCNMRCLHCGSSAGLARPNELTVRECLGVADQLLELGCRRTTFIGGELLLYRGWERVARRMRDGGCLVNAITNGYIFGDDQVRQIRFAGLSNVAVSLDGMRESHNRIRNNPQSFDRAIATIDRLRDEGISVGAVTSLLRFNIDDLEAMHELLAEKGVTIWQLQLANAMGNLAAKRKILPQPSRIPEITRFICEKRESGPLQVFAGDNIGYFDKNEPYLRGPPGTMMVWHGCQAGLRVVGIDSVGNVKGCESLYADAFIEGNLRQNPLKDIWFREGAFAYNRNFSIDQLDGTCAGCDKGPQCRGGCRGSCTFTTGSMFHNPYCCYRRRHRASRPRPPASRG